MANTFLTFTACLLGFCADKAAETPTHNAQPNMHQSVSTTAPQAQSKRPYKTHNFFTPTGKLGNYLASRFAQQHHEWDTAYDFLQKVITQDKNATSDDIERRAMLLAISAGEFEKALNLSESLVHSETPAPLAEILQIMSAIRDADFQRAQEMTEALQEDGISKFMRPLLTGWVSAALGEGDVSQLDTMSFYLYHAVLIKDFTGQRGDMAAILEQALTRSDLKIIDIERIGDAFTQIQKPERAKDIYKEILKASPNHLAVQAKLKQLEADESLIFFEPVITPQDGIALGLYDLARMLYFQGGDESARFVSQLSLFLNPNRIETQALLASMAASNEQLDEAIYRYNLIPETHPDYLEAQREIANLLEEQGNHNEAIETLQGLADRYGDIESLIKVGDLYRRDERFSKAVQSYNRAVRAIPKNAKDDDFWHLYYARGMAYERLKKWDKARSDLEFALSVQPDHPYILNYMGYALADRNEDLSLATKMIEKAVSLRPTDGYITDSLGWVYYRTGQYDDAVKILEHAVALLPYDSVVNDHLGDAYWQTGRKREARFQWQRSYNYSDKATEAQLIAEIQDKLENGLKLSPSLQHAQRHDENETQMDTR